MLKFSVKVEAKTDKEFLEELLEGCNDPEQRFALMLMMAFLEVNPNYSLNDLTEEMAGGGQFEQTQLSPATAVMVAIQRLMEKDNTIQEFPLLKDASPKMAREMPRQLWICSGSSGWQWNRLKKLLEAGKIKEQQILSFYSSRLMQESF